MQFANTSKIVADPKAIKRGDLTTVYPMIVQKARVTWGKLPVRTQAYVSVGDIVADGVNFTYTEVVPKWKKNKKCYEGRTAKISTYLFKLLDNKNKNILKFYYAQERNDNKTTTIDTFASDGTLVPMGRLTGMVDTKASPEDLAINKIDTERAFLRVYQAASPLLRKYLIKWLLQPKTTRFKDGIGYRVAFREFRILRSVHRLTLPLCQHLILNEDLRTELCFQIVFVLKLRTPRKDHYINLMALETKDVDKLQYTRELQLVPLAARYVNSTPKPKAKVVKKRK